MCLAVRFLQTVITRETAHTLHVRRIGTETFAEAGTRLSVSGWPARRLRLCAATSQHDSDFHRVVGAVRAEVTSRLRES